MCGSYRLAGGIDLLKEIENTIGAPVVTVSDAARVVLQAEAVNRAYHDVPVIHTDAEGEARITLMYWQLIYFWSRSFESKYTNFNTRVESLEKKHNTPLVRHHRCLLPATGFFEARNGHVIWPREAYEFLPARGGVMMLGGIYSIWQNPDDERDRRASCSVITVEPSQIVREVHPRMPFVVPAPKCGRWLDPGQTDFREMLELIQPLPTDQLVRRQKPREMQTPKN
ncbi:MAG: SOS response-associated peptidase [Thermoleophilia bacterium]